MNVILPFVGGCQISALTFESRRNDLQGHEDASPVPDCGMLLADAGSGKYDEPILSFGCFSFFAVAFESTK